MEVMMDVIIVRDYPIPGNQVIGVPYHGTFKGKRRDGEYCILDDGDIYLIDDLKRDYQIRKIYSKDIIKKFGFK